MCNVNNMRCGSRGFDKVDLFWLSSSLWNVISLAVIQNIAFPYFVFCFFFCTFSVNINKSTECIHIHILYNLWSRTRTLLALKITFDHLYSSTCQRGKRGKLSNVEKWLKTQLTFVWIWMEKVLPIFCFSFTEVPKLVCILWKFFIKNTFWAISPNILINLSTSSYGIVYSAAVLGRWVGHKIFSQCNNLYFYLHSRMSWRRRNRISAKKYFD